MGSNPVHYPGDYEISQHLNEIANNREDRPQQQQRGRGRGSSSSRARNQYQAGRSEQHRAKTGAATQASIAKALKENLGAGIGLENVQGRLQLAKADLAIALPITSRGIGMGLCQMLFSLQAATLGQVPDIYGLYRAGLALYEAKLQRSKRHAKGTLRLTNYYRDVDEVQLQSLASGVSSCIEPIRQVVNAVGHFEHRNCVYRPAMMANLTNALGARYPQPGNILLSNLRWTVEALSDPTTPELYRAAFIENNSIPGAIYENNLLTNPARRTKNYVETHVLNASNFE
ncbi:hypothetical protein QAD02_023925 [Eretmocerus hayati]|uniref:Uncharacterized protein n=1 Tax=Eretmocerus hayati TaxID=131215 RepID=A0ACC2PXJ6_9HYME|nr:hypothetical protein QAD02_023925 [Eretmocerus hayati]